MLARLTTTVWPTAVAVLDPIAPTSYGNRTEATIPASITWIVWLCLDGAVAMFLVALGQGAGRRGESTASFFFWSGVCLLIFPFVSRIVRPVLARGERLILLILLGEFFFLYKLLYSPSSFTGFDEMLHWVSANNILYTHRLFVENPLLPISAYYPALEIITTALVNLTGLAVFPASVLVIGISRAVFVLALFLFFEKLSGSARIAALAMIINMGCATFIGFNSGFAYESLAIVLCVLIMMLEANIGREPYNGRAFVLALILLACLAVTHHLTTVLCTLYVIGVVVVEALRRDEKPLRVRLGMTGALAVSIVVLVLLWISVKGNPVIDYLDPVISRAVQSLYERLFNNTGPAREMFVGENGETQPFLNRFIGVTSVILLTVGLTTGFFRSLTLGVPSAISGWSRLWQIMHRHWGDSRIILLTIGAFGFPVSVAFRLTVSGWEIGNRMSTVAFLSVGLVVAVSIVHFWQVPPFGRWKSIVLSIVMADILLGSVIVGSVYPAVHGSYKVVADAQSIEPMGIDAAVWTKTWLGEENTFAADRNNRTLLAAYGAQQITSSLNGGVDFSSTFFVPTLSPEALWPIRQNRIEYLLVDLRLSTAHAVLGEYYDRGTEGRYSYGNPPVARNLLKFDHSASRVFDNGWIVIYDVRRLQHVY
jgi:hypothetical protein